MVRWTSVELKILKFKWKFYPWNRRVGKPINEKMMTHGQSGTRKGTKEEEAPKANHPSGSSSLEVKMVIMEPTIEM